MKEKYEAVIGLEIHAELATASKMFCSCANASLGEPNTNVCPICLGFPGTLPVPNKKAVELTLKVGTALHCQVAEESKFDRKNYFYPDLPKGYQISQYDLPFTGGGHMTVEGTKVRIRRVHLEEDTGKNIHKEGKPESLVDYNRAGVPLIELVTEPDITSPQLASAFAKELQRLLRSQSASAADMEKGQMRVEANVSVRRVNEKTSERAKTHQPVNSSTRQLGTKVEIKNLNSFRSVEKAIEHEINRQIELSEKGEDITQETRGWDEDKGQTFSQRTKEEAEDYRYFPEPDIPPLAVAEWGVKTEKLPEELRQELAAQGLTPHQAQVITADANLMDLYQDVKNRVRMTAVEAANWLINEGLPTDIDRKGLVELLDKVKEGTVTAPKAKEILKKAKETKKIELPKGVQVISDQEQLASIIDEVIAQNPVAVSDVKAGKMQAMGFLVGQVMAKTKGQANPKVVNDLLKKRLEAQNGK